MIDIPSPGRRPLNRSLILFCLFLCVVIVIEITGPSTSAPIPDEDVGRSLTSPQIASLEFDPIPPSSTFSEVTERPLFNEGRRPHLSPQEPSTKLNVTVLGSDLQLRGIVIVNNSRFALLQSDQDSEYLRLAEGDTHAQHKIVSIEHDHIIVHAGGYERTLWLKDVIGTDRQKLARARPRSDPSGPAIDRLAASPPTTEEVETSGPLVAVDSQHAVSAPSSD